MLVDNPLQPSPFVVNPNDFSEFFNLDLLVGGSSSQQQGQGSSSSRASSNSPAPSFSALPSPPAPFLPTIVDSQATDFFNFYLDDEYTKVDPLAPPPPITGAPYDFFGAFSGLSSSSSQDESSPESGTTSTGQSPPLAIDPQLVGTPSKPMSDIDEEEEAEGGDEGDEEHDDLFAAIVPVKVGGKGKGRKGTVQSGGVQKKPIVSAVVKDSDNKDEPDDWRPSPEEYKKMSSKEKRQLRNKISARNFRVRRKEYITTLEGDIAERDRLIDAIRTELGSTKSENSALRQEISALKKALLTGRAESPVLPPPGPIPPPVRASTTSSPLVTPNMHKDLPSSPRLASTKSFWGGSATFGGITPVHTTLIPESFAQPLANVKPVGSDRSIPASLQENINPSLNVNKVGLAAAAFGPVKGGKPGAFDAFAENNPFTMKMLDAYRMQLWTRMATAQHQQQQQQQALSAQPPHAPITGLASNLRPHYFSAVKSSSAPLSNHTNLSAVLSGKHTSSSSSLAYPSPPPSPKLGATAPRDVPNPQHALIAAMASQTLFQKLGSAFWEAFSGSTHPLTSLPGASGSRQQAWDAEKVRRVLEGKAIVKVVDIEDLPTPASVPAMSRAQVQMAPVQAPMAATAKDRCSCVSVTDILEESMRALSLGKK